MSYRLEVPLDDENRRFVRVEIDEPAEGPSRVARPGGMVNRVSRSLNDMLGTIAPIAQTFADNFSGRAGGPDQVTVQFGLSLTAEADAVIAKAGSEANFSVTLAWNPNTKVIGGTGE